MIRWGIIDKIRQVEALFASSEFALETTASHSRQFNPQHTDGQLIKIREIPQEGIASRGESGLLPA
jgi:hypothetical protein